MKPDKKWFYSILAIKKTFPIGVKFSYIIKSSIFFYTLNTMMSNGDDLHIMTQ